MAFRFNAVSGQLDLVSGSSTVPDTQPIVFRVNGNGSPVPAAYNDQLRLNYSCTIKGWTLYSDVATTCSIDVRVGDYADYPLDVANSITDGNNPTLTAATIAEDNNLSDWLSVTVTAGQFIGFNIDSNDVAEQLTLVLDVEIT